MYRLQTGTTPGILVIINFLTGQFISFRVFSSLNQMYILENKFQDFNFHQCLLKFWTNCDIWCDLLLADCESEWEQSDINCCCYWPPQTHGVSSPSSQFPVFNVGRTRESVAITNYCDPQPGTGTGWPVITSPGFDSQFDISLGYFQSTARVRAGNENRPSHHTYISW